MERSGVYLFFIHLAFLSQICGSIGLWASFKTTKTITPPPTTISCSNRWLNWQSVCLKYESVHWSTGLRSYIISTRTSQPLLPIMCYIYISYSICISYHVRLRIIFSIVLATLHITMYHTLQDYRVGWLNKGLRALSRDKATDSILPLKQILECTPNHLRTPYQCTHGGGGQTITTCECY